MYVCAANYFQIGSYVCVYLLLYSSSNAIQSPVVSEITVVIVVIVCIVGIFVAVVVSAVKLLVLHVSTFVAVAFGVSPHLRLSHFVTA